MPLKKSKLTFEQIISFLLGSYYFLSDLLNVDVYNILILTLYTTIIIGY